MAQHQAAVANNSKSSRADDHSPDAKQANKVNARANADVVLVDAHTMLLIQNNNKTLTATRTLSLSVYIARFAP